MFIGCLLLRQSSKRVPFIVTTGTPVITDRTRHLPIWSAQDVQVSGPVSYDQCSYINESTDKNIHRHNEVVGATRNRNVHTACRVPYRRARVFIPSLQLSSYPGHTAHDELKIQLVSKEKFIRSLTEASGVDIKWRVSMVIGVPAWDSDKLSWGKR